MHVFEEIDAEDVRNRCWAGAKTNVGLLSDGELNEILWSLEDLEPMSWTELNDFFWFEDDWIAKFLGYNDYDEFWEERNRKNAIR